MGDMGAIGTNLHRASKLPGPYISALKAVESRGGSAERPGEAGSLLAVLAPLSRQLGGRAYFVLGIDGDGMSEFPRLRHRERWPGVMDGILAVKSRTEGGAGGRVRLSCEDLSILVDVSDALDSECASLFREMRRR